MKKKGSKSRKWKENDKRMKGKRRDGTRRGRRMTRGGGLKRKDRMGKK